MEGLTKLFRAISKEEGKQKFEETLAEVVDSISKESFVLDCICPKATSTDSKRTLINIDISILSQTH